jgi:TonB family protein
MKKIFLLALLPIVLFAQEGIVKNYYPDGKVESEINYLNGIREGEAKFYNEDGFLREELLYVSGRIDGLVKIYGDSGKLKELINLEDGKRHGPVSLFNEAGEYVSDIYFEEGKKLIIPEPVIEPQKEIAASDPPVQPVVQTTQTKNDNEVSLPPAILDDDKFRNDPAWYMSAEIMPEPVGGMESIQKRVNYPSDARKRKVEGVVKVLAYIDEYGVVEKAEVVEKLGYGTDEAAQITVFYTKFKPGLLRGRPVRVQMIVPVEFKLN